MPSAFVFEAFLKFSLDVARNELKRRQRLILKLFIRLFLEVDRNELKCRLRLFLKLFLKCV